MDSNYPPPFDMSLDDDIGYGPQSGGGSGNDNFKVVVRVRPPLPRELRGTGLRAYQCTTAVEQGERNVILSENLQVALGQQGAVVDGSLYNTHRFTFDHVYDQHSSQDQVYVQSAQQVVLSILQGYNAAIIAYGQTGTGKTYTMEGALEGPDRGIIPRTVEDIFTYIVNDPEPTSKYLVRSSYLQIYNEVVSDLLKPERAALAIREDRRRGVFVDGLSEWVVRSPAEVYQLMQRGQALRATGATKLNELSSRSHAVCVIIVEKCTPTQGEDAQKQGAWRPTDDGAPPPAIQSIKVGKLNLVDLAGSERVHVTGAVGRRLEESKKINASLSALGNVIAALTDRRERSHIPYRDSKLTRLLEDSLGGNCRTTMIATIAPSLEAYQESLSTLKFANRAKNIQNEAHVNEDVDQRTLLRKYERELRRLRDELARRSRNVVDKRQLLVAEEQAKRAEADKLAALTALQERSKEFLREKEEKRQLEIKIQAMQSQFLSGGSALHEVPAFKVILQREANRMREQYESRIRAMEAEREAMAAAASRSAEVERYKELLLKQRDIMIALTARLNERDDNIVALQEELEAYERYQRQLEDQLDAKTAELIALRKAAVEHAASSPSSMGGYAPLQTALGDWAGGSTGGGAEAGLLGPGGTQQLSIAPDGRLNPMGSGDDGQGPGGPLLPTIRTQLQGGAADGGRMAVEVQMGLDSQDVTPRGSASAWQGAGGQSASFTAGYGNGSSGLYSGGSGPLQQGNGQMEQGGTGAMRGAGGGGGLLHGYGSGSSMSEAAAAASPGEVEELRAAAVTAAKERAALQQILDSKVKVMVTEIIREVSSAASGGFSALGGLSQQVPGQVPGQLLSRLSALEQLVARVSGAIGATAGPTTG